MEDFDAKVLEKGNINLVLVREGDIIHLSDGNVFEVLSVGNSQDGHYILDVMYQEKQVSLVFNITGDSLEHGADIVKVELVPNETDSKTFYYPRFEVDVLPVLEVNGEQKFIYAITDLNGLEVKGEQVLKASYKYTIINTLIKQHGRSTTGLKRETIICESEEECMKKLDEISNQFVDADREDSELIKELFIKNCVTK